MSSVIKSYQYDRVAEAAAAPANPTAGVSEGVREAQQQQTVLGGAFEKARQIVESAQEYRIRIEREAAEAKRQDCEEARRSGYREGYDQGMAEGRAAGTEEGKKAGYAQGSETAEAENRRTLEELSRMIEAVEKSKTDVLRKFEDGIEELAFTMARTVLKRELSLNKETLRSILLAAVDSYRNQAWVRIRVSERDAGVLLRTDGGIAKALKNVSDSVKVIPVPEMEDGSCVIEMPDQVIDAGIDTQLRKMKAAVESAGQDKAG